MRSCEAHLKIDRVDKKKRIITGVASRGDVDRAGTVVDQDTLEGASKRFLETNHSLFLQHDWDALIGKVVNMELTDNKLIATAEIGHGFDVPFGFGKTVSVDDVWAQIEQGFLNSFSIGFRADLKKGDKEKNTPDTLEVTDLLELSIVTIPANVTSQFSVSRGILNGTDCYTTFPKMEVNQKESESELEFTKIIEALRKEHSAFNLDQIGEALSQWKTKNSIKS